MDEHISLIIKNLDPAKAHGCGNISIKMIKVCSESLTVTLKIIFEQSLKEGRFSAIWKKQVLFRYTKKKIKVFQKIIVPLAYFPSLVKYLKELSIILYSTIFKVTNFALLHNQVFYLVIHVLPNYCQLYMKYKQHLITIQLLM